MCKEDTLSNTLISLRKQQKNELLKSIIIEYLTQSYLKYQTKVDIKTYKYYIEVKSVVYLECEKSIRTQLHDFINDIYNKYPEFISSPRITYGYEKDTIYFSTQFDAAEFSKCLKSVVKDELLFNLSKIHQDANDYYTIKFNKI